MDQSTLQTALRGNLIRPGDPDYDAARVVYNAQIDRRPAFIVRCADEADVIHAVNFARENRLDLAIRGGSHNVAGLATCDNGLVIDLSRMKGIRVDAAARTARVQGGCTWGDVDHATHAFGLAAPGGIISSTGVTGLTLGGGIGYLSRHYGLSCDNLLSADMVLADGSFITVSASQRPDLFWAIRGGGGNFGVVTSMEFRLHRVDAVTTGVFLYRLEDGREAFRMFREFMAGAPDEVAAFFAFLVVPPGPHFPQELHNRTHCGIVYCHSGSLADGQAGAAPLSAGPAPVFQLVAPMPFPALQSMFDPLLPPGLHHYWKSDFVDELSDEMIERHLEYGPRIPTIHSAMHVYALGGAVARAGGGETAFHHRAAKYVHVLAAVTPRAEDIPAYREWVRGYYDALHPLSASGTYVNFLMDDEGDERVVQSYGPNYQRLLAVKAAYDPANLFHLNHNIRSLSATAR